MTELRELLVNAVKKGINDEKEVAILFSGGTDSLTCLFSCLELMIEPKLYTFHLENFISEDSRMAKKIADFYNLSLQTIVIKEDVGGLEKDVYDLIKKYKLSNRIRIQILYPFPYILPAIKENVVLTGLSADTLYGTNYHSKIHFLDNFSELRRQALEDDEIDGYNALKLMVENFGKKLVAPYRDEEVINYFLRYSWEELNLPKQKNPSVEAFRKYFDAAPFYRKSSSLPINSRIREWHEKLLKTRLNKYNRNSVDEIYNDIFTDKL